MDPYHSRFLAHSLEPYTLQRIHLLLFCAIFNSKLGIKKLPWFLSCLYVRCIVRIFYTPLMYASAAAISNFAQVTWGREAPSLGASGL